MREWTVTKMDRLTDKRFVGDGFYQPNNREERLEFFTKVPPPKDIYNRLAEYEDTGLTPDEIKEMKIRCENIGCHAESDNRHKENTTGDIIKTLANNGYNTITINCYKDIEGKD